jgi:tetratricopeptide (TPR) repeat protein
MPVRIIIFVLFLCVVSIPAQKASSDNKDKITSTASVSNSDDLLKHLTAAESHQLSGDLRNAAIENRAVLGIALQRSGSIAVEEGRYTDAVRILTESLKYADNAPNRTSLAIAFLRQNLFEKALLEAQTAVSIDPKHEIAGKPGKISLHRTVQMAGRNFIERGQVYIEHHFLAAHEVNRLRDSADGNELTFRNHVRRRAASCEARRR